MRVPKLSAKDLSDCGILAFNRHGKDRLRTKVELIPALAGLEDSRWGEWTGLDGTAGPHMLTQGDIGRLLRPFAVRSKTLWPPGQRPGTKSESGYSRQQFEAAWASYRYQRHTTTGEQIVAAVNRPMPATPSRLLPPGDEAARDRPFRVCSAKLL